ncbi:MAG: copper transporter [Corynebacterium sp.]|nr:copper transporter [Corynebacterium sp.]
MTSKNSVKSALVITGLGFGTALGIALGALVLAPNMTGVQGSGSGDPIREEHRRLLVENQGLQDEVGAADSLIEELGATSLAGTLTSRPVMVIATGDASERDVKGVRKQLDNAGATDAGTITLSNEFFHPGGADRLKSIIANALPAGAQLSEKDLAAGTHSGQALAAALLLDPQTVSPYASVEDRAALLEALNKDGYLSYESGTIIPAQAVVIVTGRGGDEYYTDNAVKFINAFDAAGTYTVVVGRSQAAEEGGVLDILRSKSEAGVVKPSGQISTVDPIDRDFAQFATALAVFEQLNGGAGNYGIADGVDAVAPPLPHQS